MHASSTGTARPRPADTIRPTEDYVGSFFNEIQREDLLELLLVDLRRPPPIEVDEGLEASELRVAKATFEAASGSIVLFDLDQPWQPLGILKLLDNQERYILLGDPTSVQAFRDLEAYPRFLIGVRNGARRVEEMELR